MMCFSLPVLPLTIKILRRLGMVSCLVVLFTLTSAVVSAQGRLTAGPMVGHVDMREANIWVQTRTEADVRILYRDSAQQGTVFSTSVIRTKHDDGRCATFRLREVEPGRTYYYDVEIDGTKESRPYPTQFRTQPVWKWQTSNPPSATIALGSCFYVNETGYERSTGGYGSDEDIFLALHNKRPDVMLWLGDNVYLREADWNSRSGIEKRYSHTRSLPQLQPFLASTAHYATWDDHDYGPNDSDRSWWGKRIARDVFMQFWPNPSYGIDGINGITSQFSLIDVDVFLLDDRWFRSPDHRKDDSSTILGEAQYQWLIDVLASSTATFKIVAVGSQFLTTDTRKESFARMPHERERIIKAITDNKIRGVVFVSGDIHAAELSRRDREGTYPLYELTSSSLTAGSNKNIADQPNERRVEGKTFGEHNFGLITVSGPAKSRVLSLAIHNIRGERVWGIDLNEADLK